MIFIWVIVYMSIVVMFPSSFFIVLIVIILFTIMVTLVLLFIFASIDHCMDYSEKGTRSCLSDDGA